MKNQAYVEGIKSLKEVPESKYSSLDLDRLVIYSMNIIHQKNIPLYFDYISVAAFRLFPAKFSMANFKEYPDTNRINKAIRRLTDPTRKNWATGTIEHGFNLSEAGKEVYLQVDAILSSPDNLPAKKQGQRTRGRSTRDDANEVLSSKLYKQWVNRENVSEFQITDFMGATPYTPKSLLNNHLLHLKQSAENANSQEATKFLEWLEENFSYIFKD